MEVRECWCQAVLCSRPTGFVQHDATSTDPAPCAAHPPTNHHPPHTHMQGVDYWLPGNYRQYLPSNIRLQRDLVAALDRL